MESLILEVFFYFDNEEFKISFYFIYSVNTVILEWYNNHINNYSSKICIFWFWNWLFKKLFEYYVTVWT